MNFLGFSAAKRHEIQVTVVLTVIRTKYDLLRAPSSKGLEYSEVQDIQTELLQTIIEGIPLGKIENNF